MRKIWTTTGVAACLCMCAGTVMAQTPSDTCAGVTAANTIPATGGSFSGNLVGASAAVPGLCNGSTSGSDVFYGYTPSISGGARFSLCSGPAGFDSILSVYSSCTLGAASMLSCNDDFCEQFGRSQLDVTLAASQQVFVRIARYSGTGTDGFTLVVTPPAPPPANDVCGANIASFTIPAGGGTVVGTNLNATTDGQVPSGVGACIDTTGGVQWTSGRDVYHYFTPNGDGPWTMTLCDGTNFDTILSVHSDCPASGSNLVACNDDGCGFAGPSSLVASLSTGVQHVVRIAGWRFSPTSPILGASGTYTLAVTGETLAACCSPSTGNCTLTSEAACVSPNVWNPFVSSCGSNPCAAGAYDDCAQAIVLTPGTAVNGSTVGATGTALATCTNTDIDVWFTFTPAASGSFRATCDPISGDFLSLTAYQGGCPTEPGAGLACVAALDNPSIIVFTAAGGQPVHLRVGDFFGSPGIAFTMLVESISATACCTPGGFCSLIASPDTCPSGTTANGTTCSPNPCSQPTPPANDVCATAIANPAFTIPPAGGTVTGTAFGATNDGQSSCNSAISPPRDVYHAFTPTVSSYYSFSLCGSGVEWDSVVSVHTGCPATEANMLNIAACEDFGCDLDHAEIAGILVTSGTATVVRVSTFDGSMDGDAYALTVAPIAAGACCGISGNCFIAIPTDCTAPGIYVGDASACAPNPCPPSGSCCLSTSSLCFQSTQAACATTLGGTWVEGQACDPNPCIGGSLPENNACENAATITFPSTVVIGSDLATNDGPIAPQGACNYPGVNEGIDNSVWYTFTAAQDGAFTMNLENFLTYDAVVVLYSGATCAAMTEVACEDEPEPIEISQAVTAGTVLRVAVGDFGTTDGGGWNLISFSFTPTATSENCCRGTTCISVAAGSCTGTVAGSNSVVVSACTGNTNAGCCFGDYDHNGTKDITDIFTFLNAWFGASTYADITSNGAATPDITDIFTFLNAWFGTCA